MAGGGLGLRCGIEGFGVVVVVVVLVRFSLMAGCEAGS